MIIINTTKTIAQIDITIQKNWGEKFLVSAAFMKKLNAKRQYMQFGVNLFPAMNNDYEKIQGGKTTYKFDCYYGAYTGYYYTFLSLLRTGIHIGAGFKREKEYVKVNNNVKFNGYNDFKITPYYGFGIQIGIVSLIISNEGFGGGINVAITNY